MSGVDELCLPPQTRCNVLILSLICRVNALKKKINHYVLENLVEHASSIKICEAPKPEKQHYGEIGMKKKSRPVLLKKSIKNKTKQDGCHMSVIPALGWWRQENWEFKAILSHIMSLSVLDHITSHLRQA